MKLMQLGDLLEDDIKEIDTKKTRENVAIFFNEQYEKLKYLADDNNLKAVSYGNIKVTSSHSNMIEKMTIKQIQACQYIEIINNCINSMDEIKRKIFKYKLISGRRIWEIEELTGYGKTAIYNIFIKSCVEFAKKISLVTDINLIAYKEA